MRPIIRPAARDDILRQFRYYLVEQDNPKVAERFLNAVQRTIKMVIRMPQGGAPKFLSREALRGLRSWPVKGFEEIRVYYLAVRTGVKEHHFCRFSGQQSSLFLEAGHTSWFAAEDDAQSSRVEFSPYDFGQAKRRASRAVNGNWKKGE